MTFQKSIIVITLISGLLASPALATEFRTVHDSGVDVTGIAIGNANGFALSSLAILDAPIAHTATKRESTFYYSNTMQSDLTIFAASTKFKLTDTLFLSLAAVNERSDAGHRTSSANGSITAGESITYSTSEYVGNATFTFAPHQSLGVSGHYIYRDQFGITGSSLGLSAGYLYDTPAFGVSLGGKYINAPKINFSNQASETLNPQWYAGIKKHLHLYVPFELYLQTNWTPAVNALQNGGGLRFLLGDWMTLSTGYTQTRGIQNDTSPRLTAGVSIHLNSIRIDYSYNTADYVLDPSQHRVAVSFIY